MLVISENNGDTNMFVGIAECWAIWHNCATLYTNALHEAGSKSNPYLEMSFALYPKKTTKSDNNYTNRSSTSVSSVITYASQGVYPTDEDKNPMVSILNSKGTKYEELSESKLEIGCKVYTFETE